MNASIQESKLFCYCFTSDVKFGYEWLSFDVKWVV